MMQSMNSHLSPALARRCLCLAYLLALFLVPSPAKAARDITAFYSEVCANCHGKNMEGAQAPGLLKPEMLKHGSDDASLARSIRDGYPTNNMVAWKMVLSDAEVRSMVVFIREKQEQFRKGQIAFPKPVDGQVVESKLEKFRIKNVVQGLKTPWSIAFLPDRKMLVTELPGSLRIVEENQPPGPPVQGTPPVRARGQGGLMEVALHPGYETNGWVYLTFSDPYTDEHGASLGLTAVARGRIKDNHWTDGEIIFRAPYKFYKPTDIHFGSRIVFDGEGHLFFSMGERGVKENAQDLSRPNGKIHRIFDDGRIPPDNPFVGLSNAFTSIWCYGNRNPQGLARHPVTGDLWEAEHGPRGGDEINWIRKGLNYGWPVITYGMDYNGTPISEFTAKEGMEQPVTYWTPSIAVCAINFYTGDQFPRWKHNLFATALAQQELRRLVIDGHRVVEQEILFKNIGRVRYVVTGPDGCLYLALNAPDRIIRLEPVTRGSN
jgi:aldose sugar dehydrogenase